MDTEVKDFQSAETENAVEQPSNVYSNEDVILAKTLEFQVKVFSQTPPTPEESSEAAKVLTLVCFDKYDSFLGPQDLYRKISSLMFVDKQWFYQGRNYELISNVVPKYVVVEFTSSPFKIVEGMSEQEQEQIRKLQRMFARNYVILPFYFIEVEKGEKAKAKIHFNGINIPKYRLTNPSGSLKIDASEIMIHSLVYRRKCIPISDAYKRRMRNLPTMRDFVNNSSGEVKVGFLTGLVKDMSVVEEAIYKSLVEAFN